MKNNYILIILLFFSRGVIAQKDTLSIKRPTKNIIRFHILGETAALGGLWYMRKIIESKKNDLYLKGGISLPSLKFPKYQKKILISGVSIGLEYEYSLMNNIAVKSSLVLNSTSFLLLDTPFIRGYSISNEEYFFDNNIIFNPSITESFGFKEKINNNWEITQSIVLVNLFTDSNDFVYAVIFGFGLNYNL